MRYFKERACDRFESNCLKKIKEFSENLKFAEPRDRKAIIEKVKDIIDNRYFGRNLDLSANVYEIIHDYCLDGERKEELMKQIIVKTVSNKSQLVSRVFRNNNDSKKMPLAINKFFFLLGVEGRKDGLDAKEQKAQWDMTKLTSEQKRDRIELEVSGYNTNMQMYILDYMSSRGADIFLEKVYPRQSFVTKLRGAGGSPVVSDGSVKITAEQLGKWSSNDQNFNLNFMLAGWWKEEVAQDLEKLLVDERDSRDGDVRIELGSRIIENHF